jgi:hypothetical protein
MRVLLILFLVGLALVEYFYHYSANLESAPLAEVTSQEKSPGLRQPPQTDHHGH